MRTIVAFILCALVAVPLAAHAENATATPPPPSPWLVGRRGTAMHERDALRGIAFVPFVPTRNAVQIALLAPLRGDDTRNNRGIGYEYENRGRLFVLSQWPMHDGSITGFPVFHNADPACANVRTFPRTAGTRGIVWSAPHGTVLTLQP